MIETIREEFEIMISQGDTSLSLGISQVEAIANEYEALQKRIDELEGKLLRETKLSLKQYKQVQDLLNEKTQLNAMLDRIASDEQLNPHGDCGGDKALWCANEVIAIKEYARNRGEIDD